MSTPPHDDLPTSPSIPLSAAVRAAYQDLYQQMQAALDSTMDLSTVEALNAAQPQVEAVLTQDDLYRLHQDTAGLTALQKQIGDTNNSLKTLQTQIASIAAHFTMAAEILAAIDKVLTLVPGA
jgi:hypothetical protein